MKNTKKIISSILIILILHVTIKCSYFKIKQNTFNIDKITSLNESIEDDRYFIVEHGSEMYQGVNLEIRDDRLNIFLTRLDPVIKYQFETVLQRMSRRLNMDKNKRKYFLHEVFIRVSPDFSINTGQVEIPMASIETVAVVHADTGKNIGSFMLGTLGVVAILAIVVIATKDSCPFVYVDDGESLSFAGEAFSGAMYSPLERHDYIPLPNPATESDRYEIMIRNELQETEHINLAELMVIKHSGQLKVMIDQEGRIHTLDKPVSPFSSISNTRNSVLEEITDAGDKLLFRFDHGQDDVSTGYVDLKFHRPVDNDMAKLVVNAKISFWLDFAYGEFTSLLGDSYQSWVQAQNSRPAQELRKWQFEQDVPLKVFVKKGNQWNYAGFFEPAGPFGEPRPMIMPLDISGISNDEIEIRLQTGFNFWELDYAVLDYSSDKVLDVEVKAPVSVIDQSDTDVSKFIESDDKLYLKQNNIGDNVTLFYDLNQPPGLQTSLFLHVKGYYEPIKNYEGKPDWPYLMEFNKPGRFTEFTKELLLDYTTRLYTNNIVSDD